MSISAVRQALATAVGTISGLRTSYYVPDQINGRIAVVYRKQINYDLGEAPPGGDGGSTYSYGINVYAERTAERSAQDFLDSLCEPSGSGSIKAAVETNTALNNAVDYVLVKSASEVQISTVGQNDYLLVSFDVEVVL